MKLKMISTTVIGSLLLILAATPAPADPSDLHDVGRTTATPLEDAERLLLASAVGEASVSCVAAVFVFSLSALALGAATGGPGLAIAGAYAPLAVVVCAW